MSSRHLSRAVQLYISSKYQSALRLLEPEILSYPDNERYFLLLGLCCVRCRTIGDAVTYLQRGLRINDHNSDILQTLAVCACIQNRKPDAIAYLLTILEGSPRNKRAAALLRFLQKRTDDRHLPSRQPRTAHQPHTTNSVEHMRPFLPVIPYIFRRVFSIVLVGTIGGALVVAGALVLNALLGDRNEPLPLRAGTEEVIRAKNITQYIDLEVTSRYVLNNQQVADMLDTIEGRFVAYEDNQVCVDINRILQSNAHSQIKQRMIFLSSYLIPATFVSLSAGHSYEEVASEPYLYNSCYVRWQGAVANIRVQEQLTEFDFLVGYDSDNVLEGVARSVSDVAYDFRTSDYYEVIAQVSGSDEGIALYITDIRPLAEQAEVDR